MPRGNPSPKLAITVDPDIHESVLAAAESEGVSVSAWMTAAAREALRRRAGLAAVAQWEKVHGRFTAVRGGLVHDRDRAGGGDRRARRREMAQILKRDEIRMNIIAL